jgi:hypothetical protein
MGSAKRAAGLMATAAVMSSFVLLSGLIGAAPASAAAGSSVQQELPNSAILSVSCARAGSCSAGGYFTDRRGGTQGFVLSEAHGGWDKPRAISRLGGVETVSCASAGNCSAGGVGAYIIDEVNGRWGKARPVPGLAALDGGGRAEVTSVSCASRGNCSAGGFYLNASETTSQAFVVSEVRGQWTNALQVPDAGALNAGGNAQVTAVSCASAGNCSAIGSYSDGQYNQGFVVNEEAGAWSPAQQVPGLGALAVRGVAIDSLSCASAGNCGAGGQYLDARYQSHGFVINEAGGSWANAQQVPGLDAIGLPSAVSAMSCASAGYCSAGGFASSRGIVVSEVNGRWRTAQRMPGLRGLGAQLVVGVISCTSAGSCAASGSEYKGPFVVSEVRGRWGRSRLLMTPGHAGAMNSVMCASAGNCSGGGSYLDGHTSLHAFVVTEKGGHWGRVRKVF